MREYLDILDVFLPFQGESMRISKERMIKWMQGNE